MDRQRCCRRAEALAILAQACRDLEEVRFDYVARDGASTRRLVEPHRLVSAGRRWFLERVGEVAGRLDRATGAGR